jgi:hypothetical protein
LDAKLMQTLRRHWPMLLLGLAVAACLVYSSWDHVVTRDGWDPDDQLRMVQLRDFLAGQSWFDTTQYRMNPADGAPMHWSRLVELPLAAFVLLLTPLLGTAGAEMAAGVAVPMLCLGGIAFLLAGIAERIGGRGAGYVAAILTFIAPALLIQLRPMRIDHHGWQIFCAVLALATLFWTDKRRAGLVMGAALATWMHISLEGAPMTAAFFLILGWRWVVERSEGVRLFWTLCSFAGLSLALFLGTQADGFGAKQYCDTISPVHIWAILAAVALLLPIIYLRPENRLLRIGATALAGAAALGALLWLAPSCLQGGFGDLDPLVREYWYAKVSEGLPVWHQDPQVAIILITPLAVALVAFGAAYRFVEAKHRPQLGQLGFFLIYASILSVLVFRTISVATAFTIVPVALCLVAAFNRYRVEPVLVRRLMLASAVPILLISGLIAGSVADAIGPEQDKSEAKRDAVAQECESVQSLRALSALPPSNIVAPFDMGPGILLTTKHKVLASSHHRNAKGMRDQIEIFRLPPAESRAVIARHGINFIVACPDEAELDNYASKDPAGLWSQLAKGKVPAGFEYRGKLGQGIQVWRIR